MLTHRYIQAVLTRDLAHDAEQPGHATDAPAAAISDRAAHADAHRERAEQVSVRLADLDRRFGI